MSKKNWQYECSYCDNPLTPGMSVLVGQVVVVDENGNTYMEPATKQKLLRFCAQACVDDYVFSAAFSVTRG